MAPLIEVKNLAKTYVTGKGITTDALRGVNMTVIAGEFLAIAGPSGSGKSSLLNIMSMLDAPTSGEIIYEGTNITTFNAAQLTDFRLRHIGFVFQAYNLINTLTAQENVEFPLLLQGVPHGQRRVRAAAILKEVGLERYVKRFPNEMSGGQQQRVAVARSIVTLPRVIMADEPTANLDSATAAQLITLMRHLNAQQGITFIFSTHDPMVMEKATRLVHLKDGEIQHG